MTTRSTAKPHLFDGGDAFLIAFPVIIVMQQADPLRSVPDFFFREEKVFIHRRDQQACLLLVVVRQYLFQPTGNDDLLKRQTVGFFGAFSKDRPFQS